MIKVKHLQGNLFPETNFRGLYSQNRIFEENQKTFLRRMKEIQRLADWL